jgi:hypothetical protein
MMNLKRLALPLLAALAIGLGGVVAQNITKSVQLSQDGSGPIGFDTTNGVYFPGHLNSTSTTPSYDGASCGVAQSISGVSTSRSIAGTDTAGAIQTGGTATQCQVVFARAYLSTPWCVFSSNTGASPVGWTVSTAGFNVTMASAAGLRVSYSCMSAS